MTEQTEQTPTEATPPAGETTTPKKSNTTIRTTWSAEKRTLSFEVAKASPTGGSMTLVLELDKIHQSNRDYAAIHGFKQKISDAAAIPFDAKAKHYATPREKYDAMAVLVEHFNSGAETWSAARKDRVSSDELMLTRALAEVYPDKTAEYVRSKVAGWTRAERLTMMDHKAVKPIIERMRAEDSKGIDAEKLLADF